MWIIRLQWMLQPNAAVIQMPFAKVSCGVTSILKRGRQHFLLLVYGLTDSECTSTIIGAAGKHRCASGCATWCTGVKPIHTQAIGCHVVEVGSFQNGMTVIAGLRPTHVVSHQEDDIRRRARGACVGIVVGRLATSQGRQRDNQDKT